MNEWMNDDDDDQIPYVQMRFTISMHEIELKVLQSSISTDWFFICRNPSY